MLVCNDYFMWIVKKQFERLKVLNFNILGFFAAMNHVGGGRNELDPRFLSLCSVFSLPFPSENTIRCIFSSILSGHTASFSENIKDAVNNIVDMTLNLYKVNTSIIFKCYVLVTNFKYLMKTIILKNKLIIFNPDIYLYVLYELR